MYNIQVRFWILFLGAAITAEQISANISGVNQEQQHEQLSNVHTQKISSSCVGSKTDHRNPINISLTAEKPYKCDYCDYRCIKRSILQRHIRTHTGEKPYKCDYCDYRCAWRDYLAQHIRTHTGEKLYKCYRCEYRSSYCSNLHRHVRTHAEKKPNKCD